MFLAWNSWFLGPEGYHHSNRLHQKIDYLARTNNCNNTTSYANVANALKGFPRDWLFTTAEMLDWSADQLTWAECHFAECVGIGECKLFIVDMLHVFTLRVISLHVITLSVILLKVIILSVPMANAIVLSILMLNVIILNAIVLSVLSVNVVIFSVPVLHAIILNAIMLM